MGIEKILVVDDEETIYSYLERKLGKLGYVVYTADDGEKAMERAISETPDIILLDVKLPKLDGIEVCKRLKANDMTKRIPIIILSAKANPTKSLQVLRLARTGIFVNRSGSRIF